MRIFTTAVIVIALWTAASIVVAFVVGLVIAKTQNGPRF